jgi:hypothetical protein
MEGSGAGRHEPRLCCTTRMRGFQTCAETLAPLPATATCRALAQQRLHMYTNLSCRWGGAHARGSGPAPGKAQERTALGGCPLLQRLPKVANKRFVSGHPCPARDSEATPPAQSEVYNLSHSLHPSPSPSHTTPPTPPPPLAHQDQQLQRKNPHQAPMPPVPYRHSWCCGAAGQRQSPCGHRRCSQAPVRARISACRQQPRELGQHSPPYLPREQRQHVGRHDLVQPVTHGRDGVVKLVQSVRQRCVAPIRLSTISIPNAHRATRHGRWSSTLSALSLAVRDDVPHRT